MSGPVTYTNGQRCRIKAGWVDAGRVGELFVTVQARRPGDTVLRQPWSVVLWDGADDPALFKTAGLELI